MSDSKKGEAITREIFTREVHYSEPISTETSSDSDSEESTLVWLLNQPLFWIAIGALAIALMTDDQAPVIINNQAPPPVIINNN
ncbi:hypothetical protein Lepto7376_3685 [[Leptolyngbya] sp. PCC 7376]|uniref:hypothetical protein n=1 Tax=[Leptolyngbya] sp. PCC 7376 TaxID=111781 RepID=UPI00029F23CD|nr:hypothetical protein [[Leptolyngbya] sp. PCC 7376]AFY39861.1 hypothetical protein Lepto7376_3685 [[Leptolyngbya] sp. PCC 7376]